jgi:3'(2'), 5'-bisphosphate nucleotidase
MNAMLAVFEQAALTAGKAIMAVRDAGPHAREKKDHSPVTEADEQAEAIILAALSEAYPQIPIIAEESVAAGKVPHVGDTLFLVDPLDGTKEFIAGRDDFTVNIALIEAGVPTAGIVYAPALQVAYLGAGQLAEKCTVGGDFTVTHRLNVKCRIAVAETVALASRSHRTVETDTFLTQNGVTDIRCIGSSLKFCLLAEGVADLYPRFGRTMEWDTAAGDAVLRAAGGITKTLDGRLLAYGKTNQSADVDFANPDFIAWGRKADAAMRVAE